MRQLYAMWILGAPESCFWEAGQLQRERERERERECVHLCAHKLCVKTIPMNTYCSRTCVPNGFPRMLTFDQKAQQVAMCAEDLHWFVLEGNMFLLWIVTCDKTWAHYFTAESKQSSMEWHHKGSPLPENSRHSCQLARLWQVWYGIQNEWSMLVFFHMV
jgi:hypothetical protein